MLASILAESRTFCVLTLTFFSVFCKRLFISSPQTGHLWLGGYRPSHCTAINVVSDHTTCFRYLLLSYSGCGDWWPPVSYCHLWLQSLIPCSYALSYFRGACILSFSTLFRGSVSQSLGSHVVIRSFLHFTALSSSSSHYVFMSISQARAKPNRCAEDSSDSERLLSRRRYVMFVDSR